MEKEQEIQLWGKFQEFWRNLFGETRSFSFLGKPGVFQAKSWKLKSQLELFWGQDGVKQKIQKRVLKNFNSLVCFF